MENGLKEIQQALMDITLALHELNEALQPCGAEIEIDRLIRKAQAHIENIVSDAICRADNSGTVVCACAVCGGEGEVPNG